MPNQVAEWVAKAEEDFSVALILIRRKNVHAGAICFHCQQAAEKLLKALLIRQSIRFGKIHDLDVLLADLVRPFPVLSLLEADASLLTTYAANSRYPGFEVTVKDAKEAIAALRRVRTAAFRILPESRPNKTK